VRGGDGGGGGGRRGLFERDIGSDVTGRDGEVEVSGRTHGGVGPGVGEGYMGLSGMGWHEYTGSGIGYGIDSPREDRIYDMIGRIPSGYRLSP
jgi:hypothetical protein